MMNTFQFTLLLAFCLAIIPNNPIKAQDHIVLEPVNTVPLDDSLYIYGLGEMAALEEKKLLVSDRLIYKIYVIDSLKAITRENGARGRGPAEFSVAPFKVTFDEQGQNIAVLDHTTPYVNIYDTQLEFITRITNRLPPSDIAYGDSEMLILGAPPTPRDYDSIFIYEKNRLIHSFQIQLDHINIAFDNYIIDYLEGADQIVLVYQNRNLIQFYTLDGTLVMEAGIEDVPDLSESIDVNAGGINKLPANHIYTSLSVDNNRVYILGGYYSAFPHRTIYVLTDDGTVLDKLVVKDPVTTIEVQDGVLYTGNLEFIKTYRLNNEIIEE